MNRAPTSVSFSLSKRTPAARSSRRMVAWLANEPLCTMHCSGPTAYGWQPAGVTADSVAIRVCPTPCQPCALASPHASVSIRG